MKEVEMNKFARNAGGRAKKLSVLGTIVLGGLLAGSSSLAQRPAPAPVMPCPHPTVQSLPLVTPFVFNGDFTAATLAAPRAGVNSPAPNQTFLHTFRWDPPGCCQITAATLTVTMRANQAGVSTTSSDAGNDMIAITGPGGTALGGMGGPVYTGPVAQNQTTIRTFVVNAVGLAAMNANNRLSFVVEDDTRVVSAVLRIERCCVNMRR